MPARPKAARSKAAGAQAQKPRVQPSVSSAGGTAKRATPRSPGKTSAAPPAPAFQLPAADVRQNFATLLLGYYAATARKLPWRDNPTGYAVWVSEMMLQQTQVATVLPYYQRWMARFPTLESLASASEADVLSLWQGLGYYARARALHAGARHVLGVRDGRLPTSAAELRALPGIGPYTAGAIASIAFEQPAPIVDGNVIRVLCRVFGLAGSPLHQPLKGFLWELAEALIPRDRARDFNQALMEFGALCCTPRSPLCHGCPLQKQCYAYNHGAVDRFPELPERPKSTPVINVAALVRRGPRVLVGQLTSDAPRWASMWQFPNVDLGASESGTEAEQRAVVRALDVWCGARARVDGRLQTLQHSVTRYRITVHLYEATLDAASLDTVTPAAQACQALAWCDRDELESLAMPAAHRKLASRVLVG